MENFNAKEYRDNLAKDLKEIRKTDPEKAQVVLDEAQQTEKYEKAEAWQKEKRDVMNEIGSEYILKHVEFMLDATAHASERGFINLEFQPFPKKENIKLSQLAQEYVNSKSNSGTYFNIDSENKLVRSGIGSSVLYENYISIKDSKTGNEILKTTSLISETKKQYGYLMEHGRPAEGIRDLKIISEDADKVVFGYTISNDPHANIVEFDRINKNLKTLEKFDYKSYKELEELNKEPQSQEDFDNFARNYMKNKGYRDNQISQGDWYGSHQISEEAKFSSKELLPNVYGGFIVQERREYNRVQTVSRIAKKAQPIITFLGKGVFIGDEILDVSNLKMQSQNNGQVIISYDEKKFDRTIEGGYSLYKTTGEVNKNFNILPDIKNIESQENVEFWGKSAKETIKKAVDSLYRQFGEDSWFSPGEIPGFSEEQKPLISIIAEKVKKGEELSHAGKCVLKKILEKVREDRDWSLFLGSLAKEEVLYLQKKINNTELVGQEDQVLKITDEEEKLSKTLEGDSKNIATADEFEKKDNEIKDQNLEILKSLRFYDDNQNFVESLKKGLENKDFQGLENLALINIDTIGVDKTESIIRKDQNKDFVVYSFLSEDKIKSNNPKATLLLAKDNVRFLRLPFTPDDVVSVLRSDLVETKDVGANLQEIQDKEILNKASQLLHMIHISSVEQFDTLPESEAKNLPKLISGAQEYFPALVGKTDKEVVEFLFQIRQNVPEVMKGQNIEGVYCDIEGTLFNGEELNQNTLDKLKEFEAQGKSITLWTDGDVNKLQILLEKNGISYPLKSKIDHAGASAEIVIDNDDQNTFSAKTKIFAKKFIKI